MTKDTKLNSSLGSLLANYARRGAMSEPNTDRPWQLHIPASPVEPNEAPSENSTSRNPVNDLPSDG